jgi:hypothetical protein
MYNNVEKGRWKVNALLPLSLFDSTMFNEQGNIFRKRVWILIFVTIVISIVSEALT